MRELLVDAINNGSNGVHTISLLLHLRVQSSLRLAEEGVLAILEGLVVFHPLLFGQEISQVLKEKQNTSS